MGLLGAFSAPKKGPKFVKNMLKIGGMVRVENIKNRPISD
jgi:hypothetical protein